MKNPLFDLPEGEIHLWFAFCGEDDDPEPAAAARDLLDKEEIARMERFRNPDARRLFLESHLLVRTALSHYADCSPAQWRFVRNDHGKPQIDPAMGVSPLSFSLTHTVGVAIVGVTRERAIGIDVEKKNRHVDVRGIIRHLFSPAEKAQLGKLSPSRMRERFFLHWTLKEAYLKALGSGVSLPLDSFGFHLSGRRPYQIAFSKAGPQDPAENRFALIEFPPRCIAALNVTCDPDMVVTLRCCRVVRPGESAPFDCIPVGLSGGVALANDGWRLKGGV